MILSQGVGIVVLASSLKRDSISLLYSWPTFLSFPAFNADSTKYLIPSKSPALSKSTLLSSAFFNCWFLQNFENSSCTYSKSSSDDSYADFNCSLIDNFKTSFSIF